MSLQTPDEILQERPVLHPPPQDRLHDVQSLAQSPGKEEGIQRRRSVHR